MNTNTPIYNITLPSDPKVFIVGVGNASLDLIKEFITTISSTVDELTESMSATIRDIEADYISELSSSNELDNKKLNDSLNSLYDIKYNQKIEDSELVFLFGGTNTPVERLTTTLLAIQLNTSDTLVVTNFIHTVEQYSEQERNDLIKLCDEFERNDIPILSKTIVDHILSETSDYKKYIPSSMDEIISSTVGIAQLIISPGLINIDSEDIKEVLCGYADYKYCRLAVKSLSSTYSEQDLVLDLTTQFHFAMEQMNRDMLKVDVILMNLFSSFSVPFRDISLILTWIQNREVFLPEIDFWIKSKSKLNSNLYDYRITFIDGREETITASDKFAKFLTNGVEILYGTTLIDSDEKIIIDMYIKFR